MSQFMRYTCKAGLLPVVNAALIATGYTLDSLPEHSVAYFRPCSAGTDHNCGIAGCSSCVRVNAISLGLIDTPGQQRLMRTFVPADQAPPMDSAESITVAVLDVLCDVPTSMTDQSLNLFTTS